MPSPYDPSVHHRRSIRIPAFDYARGAFFVTLVTQDRRTMFGTILGDEVRLSAAGRIVRDEWLRSEQLRPEIELDRFVVMPNHLHAIILLNDDNSGSEAGEGPATIGAQSGAPLRRRTRSLGSFLAQFKATTTRLINAQLHSPGAKVWQRNYFEHVIRNEAELDRIRRYVWDNPAGWSSDPNFAG